MQRDLSRDAALRFADHFAEAGIEIVDVQVEPEIRIERREKVEKELRVADALVEAAGIGEYGLRMGRIRKSADGAQVESLRNDPDPVAVDVGRIARQRLFDRNREIVELPRPSLQIEEVGGKHGACHVAPERRIAELGDRHGRPQRRVAPHRAGHGQMDRCGIGDRQHRIERTAQFRQTLA